MSVRINKIPTGDIVDFGCTRFQGKPFSTNMQNNIVSNARGGIFSKKRFKNVCSTKGTRKSVFSKIPKFFSVPFGCTYFQKISKQKNRYQGLSFYGTSV